MPGTRWRVRIAAAIIVSSLGVAGSGAQEWSWPEKPQNLQKLPKDWPGERLAPVMRGFTRALGVRCSHCHVGEEGQPLSTFDFASDANPNKDRARAMLDILGAVNDILETIEPSGETRVNMWCHTCHRGRPRPLTLAEELSEEYRRAGIEAAIARYHSLKEELYGQGAFAFVPSELDRFGNGLLEEDPEGGIEILRLNTTEHPESVGSWVSLGDAYAGRGRIDEAERSYRKARSLDPENAELTAWLDGKLAALESREP